MGEPCGKWGKKNITTSPVSRANQSENEYMYIYFQLLTDKNHPTSPTYVGGKSWGLVPLFSQEMGKLGNFSDSTAATNFNGRKIASLTPLPVFSSMRHSRIRGRVMILEMQSTQPAAIAGASFLTGSLLVAGGEGGRPTAPSP